MAREKVIGRCACQRYDGATFCTSCLVLVTAKDNYFWPSDMSPS